MRVDGKRKRVELDPTSPLLNVGCGRHFHPAWCNLDIVSDDPAVITHDLQKGLPFADNTFSVVYHSHVLEHLDLACGRQLIQECYRVLQPGGTLRVVVPDLEQIAKLYLANLERAWNREPGGAANYHWMKLELLDQMVRQRSGGQMGRYMSDPKIANSDFVRQRVGNEFLICRSPDTAIVDHPQNRARRSIWRKVVRFISRMREQFATKMVRLTMGKASERAFREGLFRSQGEIHRWMYDRFSLDQLCAESGFETFQVCDSFESRIPNYASYELDRLQGHIRKPDSLFIECSKPRLAQPAAA